ncbi:MAG: hypothetical protein CMK09_17440 [Ponticaulis sp.]|nr:hypothetical protein [Ponticaulis sp.]|tara:strand:- start:54479 stop:55675 length:1197 start_codon:yes stop_codon:yes gene_type:complete
MSGKSVARFEERQKAIIETASVFLNQHGAQGFRREDVARELKLDTSTIAYYFKKRDDLLAACLSRTITWVSDQADLAGAEPDQRARTDHYLAANLDLLASQRRGDSVPLPVLSDLATLPDPLRLPLQTQLSDAFARIIDFHPSTDHPPDRVWRLLGGNMLLNIAFWIPAWDDKFRLEDFPRIHRILSHFLSGGLLHSSETEQTDMVDLEPAAEDGAKTEFLKAATRLINRYGYKGAKVDRIAAELGLSTGSFYHHLKTKDELVVACFERTFAIIESAFKIADTEPDAGAKLARISGLIAHHQFTAETPLLRFASYQALPEDLRNETFAHTDQLAHHLAGLIADGMGDGSVRPTDPVIAANSLLAVLHGFSGVSRWIREDYPLLARDHFMTMLTSGIYR